MGNEAGSKSSSKKSNLKANWIKLSDTEKQGVMKNGMRLRQQMWSVD